MDSAKWRFKRSLYNIVRQEPTLKVGDWVLVDHPLQAAIALDAADEVANRWINKL